MIAALSDGDRSRLGKLLGLLGSSHQGERDAAALAAHRLISGKGLTWPQVLQIPVRKSRNSAPSNAGLFRLDMATCLAHEAALTSWETGFVAGLRRRRKPPTAKQAAVLGGIASRLRAA